MPLQKITNLLSVLGRCPEASKINTRYLCLGNSISHHEWMPPQKKLCKSKLSSAPPDNTQHHTLKHRRDFSVLEHHYLKKGGESLLLKNTVKRTFISICEPMKNPQRPESSCLQGTEFYATEQKTKCYTATKQVHAKDAHHWVFSCALTEQKVLLKENENNHVIKLFIQNRYKQSKVLNIC